MEQTCGNCRYLNHNSSECRYSPPIAGSNRPGKFRTFPTMRTGDWCGKWEPDKEAKRKLDVAEVRRIMGGYRSEPESWIPTEFLTPELHAINAEILHGQHGTVPDPEKK